MLGSSEERRSVTAKSAAENERSTAANVTGTEKKWHWYILSSISRAGNPKFDHAADVECFWLF